MDEDREGLISALLAVTWPDGGHEGFPTRRVAEKLADGLLDSDWLRKRDAEQHQNSGE